MTNITGSLLVAGSKSAARTAIFEPSKLRRGSCFPSHLVAPPPPTQSRRLKRHGQLSGPTGK